MAILILRVLCLLTIRTIDLTSTMKTSQALLESHHTLISHSRCLNNRILLVPAWTNVSSCHLPHPQQDSMPTTLPQLPLMPLLRMAMLLHGMGMNPLQPLMGNTHLPLLVATEVVRHLLYTRHTRLKVRLLVRPYLLQKLGPQAMAIPILLVVVAWEGPLRECLPRRERDSGMLHLVVDWRCQTPLKVNL